jgi:hypothetical protein
MSALDIMYSTDLTEYVLAIVSLPAGTEYWYPVLPRYLHYTQPFSRRVLPSTEDYLCARPLLILGGYVPYWDRNQRDTIMFLSAIVRAPVCNTPFLLSHLGPFSDEQFATATATLQLKAVSGLAGNRQTIKCFLTLSSVHSLVARLHAILQPSPKTLPNS